MAKITWGPRIPFVQHPALAAANTATAGSAITMAPTAKGHGRIQFTGVAGPPPGVAIPPAPALPPALTENAYHSDEFRWTVTLAQTAEELKTLAAGVTRVWGRCTARFAAAASLDQGQYAGPLIGGVLEDPTHLPRVSGVGWSVDVEARLLDAAGKAVFSYGTILGPRTPPLVDGISLGPDLLDPVRNTLTQQVKTDTAISAGWVNVGVYTFAVRVTIVVHAHTILPRPAGVTRIAGAPAQTAGLAVSGGIGPTAKRDEGVMAILSGHRLF